MTDANIKMSQLEEEKLKNRAREANERADIAEKKRHNKQFEGIERNKIRAKVLSDFVGNATKAGLAAAAAQDPAVYLHGDQQMILGTVPSNFNSPLGIATTIPAKRGANEDVSAVSLHPGVMRLAAVNTYGVPTNTGIDAVNKAARSLFTEIQKHTSYSKTYQSNDLMFYLIGWDSLISILADVKRAIGTIGCNTTLNQYVVDAYVGACGYDVKDLRDNWDKYAKGYNNRINLLKDFNIPALPIFDRHEQLYGGIYTDYASAKSQAYVVSLSGYQKLTMHSEPVFVQSTIETLHDPAPTSTTWVITIADAFKKFDELYTFIMQNDDFARISGDIGKAFEGKLKKFEYLPYDYVQVPAEDKNMLLQIRNATLAPVEFTDTVRYALSQDKDGNGFIILGKNGINAKASEVAVPTAPMEMERQQIATWFGESTDPRNVLDYTRLMCGWNPDGNGGAIIGWCNTEITLAMTFFVLLPNVGLTFQTCTGVLFSTGAAITEAELQRLASLVQFDNHPTVWMGIADTKKVYRFMDSDNYNSFASLNFIQMNEQALRSLLGANGIASL